jgi:serine/threonine protein kinase
VPTSRPLVFSVDLPRPGDVLGSYLIERQLGLGGMAVVYEARHRKLGRRVAIKMLLPQHAAHEELAHRFTREGEAAALLDHPNAVAVFDADADARGTPYLVLEYLCGEDLATLLKREGSLSITQTVDLLLPVIAAIAVAHDLGIVHRDLKPENVFLARRRSEVVPKVLDFGISKTAAAEGLKLTHSASLLGTPHYMSPEQTEGASQADARTDQFALGVMLYECVAGRCPFEGNSLFAVLAAVVGSAPTPLAELVAELDPSFEAAVMRALSKDPALRFACLRALGSALLPLASASVRVRYAAELAVVSVARTHEDDAADHRSPSEQSEGLISSFADDAARIPSDLGHGVEDGRDDGLPAPVRRPRAYAPLIVGSALVLVAAASIAVAAADEAPRANTSLSAATTD